MHLQWKLFITLIFVSSTLGLVSGTLLKCGEDIIVGRGERKTLKFWSAENDLLKVQLVSASEIYPRRPPGGATSYSKIPGLSEAILAHTKNKLSPGGELHYAGNPDLKIDHVAPFYDDYYAISSQDNESELMNDEYFINYPQESGESISTTESMSDFVDTTVSEQLQTTTEHAPTTTTQSSTAEGMKLVTFFPDLQNYTRGDTITANTLTGKEGVETDQKLAPDAHTNTSEGIKDDNFPSALDDNIAHTDSGVKDSPAASEQAVIDESQMGIDDVAHLDSEPSKKPGNDHSANVHLDLQDQTEEPLGDPLLAILNGNHKPLVLTNTDEISSPDGTSVRLGAVEDATNVGVLSSELSLPGVGESFSEGNNVHTMLKNDGLQSGDKQGSDLRDDSEKTYMLQLGAADNTNSSKNAVSILEMHTTEIAGAFDVETQTEKIVIGSSSATELSSFENDFRTSLPSTAHSSMGVESTTASSYSIVDNFLTDLTVDTENTSTDKSYDSQVIEVEAIQEHGSVKYGVDLEEKTAVYSHTESTDDAGNEDMPDERTEGAAGSEIILVNDSTNAVTEPSEQQSWIITSEHDKSGAAGAIDEATTVLPEEVIDGNVEDVPAIERQTHETNELSIPRAEFSSAESYVDLTTTLDELLRESLENILTNMDTEKTTIAESAKEAPAHETSNNEVASIDSIDEMEKLMSTLSDEPLFSQAPSLGPETVYHNIKHVNMAGHQNHFENTVVNNHENLLRQEDIPLDEKIEDSSPLQMQVQNVSDSISSPSLGDASSGNSNGSAGEHLEVITSTQEENASDFIKSSNTTQSTTNTAELGEKISETLVINVTQPQNMINTNDVETFTENEELGFEEENVIPTTSRPLNISPELVLSAEGSGNGEALQPVGEIETTEAFGAETTTDNQRDTTEATSQVPDGFKGYEYYENLYDSLMPQKETEGMIGIDDFLAQSGDSLKSDPEVTTLEDFDTDVLLEVDYDATKASIPQTSIDNGSQPLDPNDIEQARVPSPAWEPSNDESPTLVQISQDVGDSTAAKIENSEEGNGNLSIDGNPLFDSQDYEQTKQNIPLDSMSSDVTDGMKDIYQMRVKGPSLNTVRDDIKLNSVIDVDPSQNPILSQEIPHAETDGSEKVQNDILNSIASIIKDTLDSSDGNSDVITENILSIDATTEISDTEEYNSDNAGERNGENSNASELIEIPLEIINGEVKVSQSHPTSSLSVPISALESEEAFDNYLKNRLVNGSHVLILDNGEKVPVQSFDELTNALKSDHANIDSVSAVKDSVKLNTDVELNENYDQSKAEPQKSEDAHEISDDEISNGSDQSLEEKNGTESKVQAQPEKFTSEDGDEENERASEEKVEVFSTSDMKEKLEEADLQQSDATTLDELDEGSEALESEARDGSSVSENNVIHVSSGYGLETSTMNADAADAAPAEENVLTAASPKIRESTDGSKNVINILEDMLFNDPNLEKLITEEKKERTGDVTGTQLDGNSKSEGDNATSFADETANTVLSPIGEVSTESSEGLLYSNDFDLSSLRVTESENSPQNERPQWQIRKPARKDDSGFEFGNDTPFLMRLPGSPNPGLVYIQYEPVQVKYVPVEDHGSHLEFGEQENTDRNKFLKRTGVEQELNAIETDVLLNNTADVASAPASDAQHNTLQSPKETDTSKGIYQMFGNVIPHYDYDAGSNPNFDVKSSTESTHAHINIPLSFISRESAYKEVPDPFVVMPPPDLTSQELVNPDDPAQSMYSHVIEPHAEYQSGNLDPLILQREKAEENLISGGEVGVNKPDDEMLEPGKYYSSEHRGTIYGDVDLERLNNPVFKLQTKLHRPTADELMNPSFTPFPITTNPPREILTTQMSNQVLRISPNIDEEINEVGSDINAFANSKEINASSAEPESTASAALLISNGDASANDIFSDNGATSNNKISLSTNDASFKEPESVGYSSPPAVDFRLSYNPSDIPKFIRENPNAFPSWYPQVNDDNFRAEALTAEENTPLGSHRDVTQEISGKNFADFEKSSSVVKESARHSGNAFSRENRWPSNDNNHYGAFYHPADIPGVMMADLTRRHLSLPGNSQESRSSALPWYKSHSNSAAEIEGESAFVNDPSAPLIFGPKFFKYLNSLPAPLLRDFLEPSPSERAVRMRRSTKRRGDQIYCEWNIKTEPGLFLLMHFQNLSAPYSVDCHGAYIEVERENNGYDARYCGNRVAHMGNRPHVIFAKSEVRITVYDDGGVGKSKPTGFDADIDVIDLFNPNEYSAFMGSNSYPHIRRLLNG